MKEMASKVEMIVRGGDSLFHLIGEEERGRSVSRRNCTPAGLFMKCFRIIAGFAGFLFGGGLWADQPIEVENFILDYCADCHDEASKKAGLDLELMSFSLDNREVYEHWVNVYDQVTEGEMPPKKKDQPSEDERGAFLKFLKARLVGAGVKRQENGRAELRRLSRAEYANTLRDVLDLPELELEEMLPADGIAHGYAKSAKALDFSHVMVTRYMEVADAILRKAVAPSVNPIASKVIRAEFRGIDETSDTLQTLRVQLKQRIAIPLIGKKIDPTFIATKGNFAKREPGIVRDPPPHFDGVATFMNGRSNHNIVVKPFKVRQTGFYKIRVNGWSLLNDHGKLLPSDRMGVVAFYGESGRLLGRCELPPNEAGTGEALIWVEKDEPIEYLAVSADFENYQLPDKGGYRYTRFKSHGIALKWMEMEGPIYKNWPSESHRRLFGELPLEVDKSGAGPGYHIVAKEPMKEARKLLRRFMVRSYRRPVREDDLQIPLGMVRSRLQRGDSFLEAMLSGYRAVLTSPGFLLMEEKPGDLEAWALASRLSYFLWNSPPDWQLRSKARSGEILKSEVLREETERLLKHPKSERFVKHFLEYWVDLRKIRLTEPDKELYPEYDDFLTESMIEETRAYLAEMIRSDLGAFYVMDSDFVMVNQRTAELYGITGVIGSKSRKVPLSEDSVRGGLITQGSILKITANGTTTSPVVRGVFALSRFLGEEPPPPPAAVPAIEPDISGATTVREQLTAHRADPSCAGCHQLIDPPGFALESFDVMGAFQTRYRAVLKNGEKGVPQEFAGKKARFKYALPAETAGVLPDGREFREINGFRNHLRSKEKEIAENLLKQFIVYATGEPAGFPERPVVEAMLENLSGKDYGARAMIHEVVQSQLFRKK